ncbi:MAG: hypothetical protein KA436_04040 [Oligoflexales bacterium]|nr:hypothetical protein [Oligoflexales bacterium]
MIDHSKENICIVETEDGLHVENTVLWLDSYHEGEFSFLSCLKKPAVKISSKVLATEETIQLISCFQAQTNALVCPYNKPFSLGKLTMELLPSGSFLGAASLFIETNNQTILYAPALQMQKIPSLRSAQLKRSDILVLNAYYPVSSHMMMNTKNRNQEKKRLLVRIKQSLKQGLAPIVCCKSFEIAQELSCEISREGLDFVVKKDLFKMSQIYKKYGIDLAPKLYSKDKVTDNQIILLCENKVKLSQYRRRHDQSVFIIEDGGDPLPFRKAMDPHIEKFYIPRFSEFSAIRDLVESVQPEDLYFFGDYSSEYVRQLQGLVPRVRILPGPQPSLFLS